MANSYMHISLMFLYCCDLGPSDAGMLEWNCKWRTVLVCAPCVFATLSMASQLSETTVLPPLC